MEKKKTAKEYLVESAVELLSKGRVEKITVTDICENCGVSTRTFYNYFKDKIDLFLYIYVDDLESFFNKNKDGLTFHPFLRHTGEVLWEYRDFFQNFQAYTGQNNFRDSVFEPLMTYYERIIAECFGDPITNDIHEALTLFVHGMIGYVSWYYSQPVFQPLDDAVRVFETNMPELLKKYL